MGRSSAANAALLALRVGRAGLKKKAWAAMINASARCWTKLAKAASTSLSVLARSTSSLRPTAPAAANMSVVSVSVFGLVGSARKPIAAAAGTRSRNNSNRFDPSELIRNVTPVIFPPGRLRLATRPILTGSAPSEKTIGIVAVAALAASAEAVSPAMIIATLRLTSSAASVGKRAY